MSGFIAVIVSAIQLYASVIIDRLILGVNLFLAVGAVAFLGNIDLLLYYYATYKGVVFLSSIAFVGLITTLFSDAGFVGVAAHNKKLVRNASLQLLALTCAAIAWSYVMNTDGLLVAVMLPFMILRLMYEKLGKDVVRADRTH